MCTLGIWREAGGAGYRLWFNRDEKNTRAAESAPRIAETSTGVRHLAPRDGERGGTWLALNEHGLTVCVLNDYEAGPAATGRRSRGELPLLAADATQADQALEIVLRGMASEDFAPFRLVAMDLSGCARALHWDGRVLGRCDAAEFYTSSSFAPAAIRRAREQAHAALMANVAGRTERTLERFHWTHNPAAGADSVRMRRDDARTRSICTVHARRTSRGVEASLLYTEVDWARADGVGPRQEVRL